MGYFILALVSLGLLAYLASSFVGLGDESEPRVWGEPGVWLRRTLDRLHGAAPLFLAIIWIGYGFLHLTSPVPPTIHAAGQKLSTAELQVPSWLWPFLSPLWYGSGAVEVALGLFVVQTKWRRWALLAQLWMLVALTPFLVHILGQDDAVTDLLRGLSAATGRVVLVLHNLLLFIWVARVYRDESKRLGVPLQTDTARPDPLHVSPTESAPKRELEPVIIVALVMLAANIAGCWVIAVGPWMSGALYLWAMGSLATGALVGFIFGVPRWVAAKGRLKASDRTRYRPNTNIEKLSDWLTKMLVGVGLVELDQIGPTLSRASAVLANGLSLRPGRVVAAGEARAFATGLVAYFLVAGVIQGFLLTRMFIARAWNAEAAS